MLTAPDLVLIASSHVTLTAATWRGMALMEVTEAGPAGVLAAIF